MAWSLPASTAVHLLTLAMTLVVMARSAPATPPDAVTPNVEVIYLEIQPTPPQPTARPSGGRNDDAARLEFDGFSIDLAIFADGRDLFPFFTGPLPIGRVSERSNDESIRLTLPDRGAETSRLPALELSGAEQQALVDQMWSRRHRWQAFSTALPLFERYDANEGQLADLLKAHLDQNQLQPFVVSHRYMRAIPDPRMWAQLELAAQHGDFIAFASDYINDHPSTRTSTECLFLLEELAQGSLDTLAGLTELNLDEDLAWTRESNPAAYELMLSMRSRYVDALVEQGLQSRSAMTAEYAKVRLRLLDLIVRTSPDRYRVNDARFLMGEILWKQNRIADATQAWRGIRPDPDDLYHAAYSDVRAELAKTLPDGDDGLDPNAIDRALRTEQLRWVQFSINRLRQFGYETHTF